MLFGQRARRLQVIDVIRLNKRLTMEKSLPHDIAQIRNLT